jgi:peroxiredoxin
METRMTTLKAELDARRSEFIKTAPAEKAAAFQRGVDELAASGIAERALRAGESAPEFTLVNARGEHVALSTLLARGPVVLTFYRGGWCPYCNLQLRAYQRALPEFAAAGASLVAISPEKPDDTLSTAEKNGLAFEVLSDADGAVGAAYRLYFDLSPELKALYEAAGNDLSKKNADGRWHLPIPATYVIGAEGRIGAAWIDVEYRNRAETADILAAVRALKARAAA